jgi:hypothetical protein
MIEGRLCDERRQGLDYCRRENLKAIIQFPSPGKAAFTYEFDFAKSRKIMAERDCLGVNLFKQEI